MWIMKLGVAILTNQNALSGFGQDNFKRSIGKRTHIQLEVFIGADMVKS